MLGIIGKNGAGKSTLLKILSRITEPTSGKATIRGRVSSLLEVGTGFHPELTGRDNIYMNGTILGMTRHEIASKFDEIVDFSGVEGFLDIPVKRYSSGMTVRLAFAVAAHLQPEVLIVDEVLAVGDLDFQRKCLGKMESIATSGRTVVFVSHNMGSVAGLCQRAIHLQKGSIRHVGPVLSVIDEYISDSADGDSPAAVEDKQRNGYWLRFDTKAIQLRCGEPLTLNGTIEAPADVTDPSIGIVISNHYGPVVGASSKCQREFGDLRLELAPPKSGALFCVVLVWCALPRLGPLSGRSLDPGGSRRSV